MQSIPEFNEYFGTLSGLYTFFKLAAVKEQYGGGSLKRLIETRWSGHLASCKAVNENYDEIVKTLTSASQNRKLDCTQRATAIGFRAQIVDEKFIFLCHFVQGILKNCDMANKTLQSSKENLVSAMESIASVRKTLREKRNEYTNEKIVSVIEEKRGNCYCFSSTRFLKKHE